MTNQFEIVETQRGALAVRDTTTGEVMHPVVGARVEAEALYVGPSRLRARLAESSEPLMIYDVGLGAGSNAGLAWRVSEQRLSGQREPGSDDGSAWQVLEHCGAGAPLIIASFDRTLEALRLAHDRSAAAFHLGDEVAALLSDGEARGRATHWQVHLGELPATLEACPHLADIVFWDPFSPRANPALWTIETFRILRARCNAGATVHTYSTSTAVRAALLLAGFAVGYGPAIGSKRETTIAATDPSLLRQPLDDRWLARLGRSSAPLPAGAPEHALARIRRCPQFV